MNTLKTVIVAAVVALGVLFGGGLFTGDNAPLESKPIGALTGPEIASPYLAWGGVYHYAAATALTNATTTPCAIQSPAATSTLSESMIKITIASSTATTWTLAKSLTPYATTTVLIPNTTLGSGVQGVMGFFGTSTPAGGTPIPDPTYVFSPNTYLVWSVAGVNPSGTGLSGVCQAEFTAI